MQDYPPQGTMQGKEAAGTTLRPASEISESSQIVSSQQQESRMSAVGSIEEVSDQQHAEGENQGLDLNKSPKPKRKKHRPKVVIEGKPARTPKPATPAPKTPRRPRNSETPPVKRKYVRRKKAVGSSDKVAVKRIYVRRKKAVEPSDKAVGSSDAPWSVSVEVVDQEGGNGRKSVKRSLNFETQDSEAKAREECVAGTTDHSNANSTVYSSDEAWDLAMESSLEGLKFDWNISMNQLLNEWHPETPTPPHLVRFACNAEAPAHERSVIGTFVSSDTNTTLHSSTQAYCPPARNSLTEMAFDLNCPSDQLPTENVRIPGNPTPPPQPWGQEMMRINQMQLPTRRDEEDFKKHSGKTNHRNNAGTSKTSLKTDSDQLRSNKASDNLLKGIKRHRSYIDEYLNFLRATSSTELRSSGSQQRMASRSPCFSEVHKKKRTENKHNRSTSDITILTRAPSNCGKLRPMGPTNCEDFTFADAQTFMAGMQASEQGSGPMLMFDQVEGQRQNKLNKAHSPTSVGATVDYKQQSDQEKPSDNAGCNQPPTPEKPLGCHVSLRNELHDSQSHSAVKDVSRYTKPRSIRCRKKEQTHTVNVMSSYNYQIHLNELMAASQNGVSSLGKDSIWVNVSAARNSKDKNSRHGIGSVQDCEDSSRNRRTVCASLQHGTIVLYRDPVDDIVHKLRCLNINGHHDVAVQAHNAIVPCDRGGRAMVPYEGPFEFTKRRRPRAKVDLDPESDRVWKLLMGNDRNNGNEGIDLDKEKWWEEERRVFRGRADSFIARMHLIQGDRRFSQWKGSVVDSVIGVFLTQNVSDHLSSSAFMALAARFPLQSRGKKRTNNAENISTFTEQPDGCIVDVDDTSISWEKRLGQDLCDQGAFLTHKPVHIEEKVSNEKEIERSHESPDSGSGTTVTVTGSTSVAEGEDRRSVEDAVSSQNSLISSQSSSEYIVHAADNKKLSSIFNVEADDLLDGGVFNDLDSKSFTELLQMAENRKFQELPFPGNERVSSAEYSEIYQLASQPVDKRSSVPVPSNFPNGGSHSIDTSQSHLHPRQHDFTSLTCAPPSYYKHDSPNSRLVGTENANVQREQSISYLPPIPFEINMKTKIKITVKESASVENPTEAKGHQESLLVSTTAPPANSCTSINSSVLPSTSSVKEVCVEMHSCRQTTLLQKRIGTSNLYGNTADFHEESEAEFCMKSSQQANKDEAHMQHHTTPEMCLHVNNDESHDKLTTSKVLGSVESRLSDTTCTLEKISAETATNVSQAQRVKAKAEKNQTFDWDSLRRQACSAGTRKERSINTMDSVDWEALRCADVNEVSHTIRERGMNNILAGRIKDFLNRLVREHGSIDLEWLRDIPPDKAKDYLLSIRGLGLKSVECVRLLTLHHLAFPVDTNVGRICVRLGWVPLQPLPESLQLHLLEMYPVLETIQKYLWPRLCKLDQRTLYELHYQMITFGKVFCTKSKPNCNACPMRGECKHFASAFASARLALPGPEEKGLVSSSNPTASEKGHASVSNPIPLPQLEGCELCQDQNLPRNCEPIIEEPATPEPECMETCESAIEDAFYEDPDEIPTIKLNLEEFTQNLQNYMQENNMEIQDGDLSKALVAITPEAASIPMPKLKNVSRLRTEHQVYELPDSHPLLEGLDKREPDDPCPYLLAIWTPGETAQSIEPPKVYCNSQDTGKLCDKNTCFSCNSIREAQAQTVRGTLLIPCRTAMRGSFPLNGTYFQVNEVFADHDSSRNPIEVPRDWIWNLARRTVCFGTSVPTIFRGLSTEGIQHCFWRGFICVRGFDRTSRAPRPLYARLHFPASKVTRNKKTTTATKEEE